MASETRSIELSLDYRLWVILRQNNWTIPVTGMLMTPITNDPVTGQPYPVNTYVTSDGMPWCFVDANGDIDTSSIVVYVSGVAVDPSTYYVKHRHGQVVFDSKPTGPVTADALVSAAHVIEGYPDNEWITKNELPAIAWFNPLSTGEAFHIGSQLEDRSTFFTIDILGNNWGQTSDLMDIIKRCVVKTAWIDMSSSQPLNTNESANYNFSPENQMIDWFRMQRRPRAERLPPRVGGLDKERHRAVVSFSLKNIS